VHRSTLRAEESKPVYCGARRAVAGTRNSARPPRFPRRRGVSRAPRTATQSTVYRATRAHHTLFVLTGAYSPQSLVTGAVPHHPHPLRAQARCAALSEHGYRAVHTRCVLRHGVQPSQSTVTGRSTPHHTRCVLNVGVQPSQSTVTGSRSGHPHLVHAQRGVQPTQSRSVTHPRSVRSLRASHRVGCTQFLVRRSVQPPAHT